MTYDVTPNQTKKTNVTITQETRDKLSKARKEFFKNNPDKKPWVGKNRKAESIPEKNFREYLEKQGITGFTQNYNDPSWERNFAVDFAHLEQKVAIEVNGTQHYNKDGTLKEYYQTRNDFLKGKGWKVSEIYYTEFFKDENMQKIIDNTLDKEGIVYSSDATIINGKLQKIERRILEEKAIEDKLDAEASVYGYTKNNSRITQSVIESRISQRKVIRPSKEELQEMINTKTLTDIGIQYGVSMNAIKKWCKSYSIKTLGADWKIKIAIGNMRPDELQELILKQPLVEMAKTLGVTYKSLSLYCDKYGLKKPSYVYCRHTGKLVEVKNTGQ